ncbi:DUF4190 domain-containing protein [Streptomyces sp. TP-A0356]|uniref:DUF4190 domain-containing protein n=1 Tax=Streptomyces sp. TP-A0356 TaxID=1359208 RepID=UPI0006E1F3CF|nr:DUF4190 domain-containing protein [Streptomyces sp. TP-A0356]
MSDEAHPGQGAAAGGDNPWAPPEQKVPMDKPGTGQPPASLHDQLTMGGTMPVAGASFPPPASGPAGGSYPVSGPGQAAAGPAQAGAPVGTPLPSYQGFPLPPPPAAPADPGASAYAAPGGYGYPVPPGYAGYGWPGMPMPPRNGLGVAALVLGILSVCLFCLYGVFSLVLGILAVIFGIKGRKRADQGEADNRGQAQAGFVLGIIGIVLGIAVIALLIIVITAAINEDKSHSSSPYVGNALGASAPVLFHD